MMLNMSQLTLNIHESCVYKTQYLRCCFGWVNCDNNKGLTPVVVKDTRHCLRERFIKNYPNKPKAKEKKILHFSTDVKRKKKCWDDH